MSLQGIFGTILLPIEEQEGIVEVVLDDQEKIQKSKESCNALSQNWEVSERHNDEDDKSVHVDLVVLVEVGGRGGRKGWRDREGWRGRECGREGVREGGRGEGEC